MTVVMTHHLIIIIVGQLNDDSYQALLSTHNYLSQLLILLTSWMLRIVGWEYLAGPNNCDIHGHVMQQLTNGVGLSARITGADPSIGDLRISEWQCLAPTVARYYQNQQAWYDQYHWSNQSSGLLSISQLSWWYLFVCCWFKLTWSYISN